MKDLFILFLFIPFFLGGQTYDQNVLSEIVKRAEATHSDALIIYQNGQPIYESHFGQEEKPVYIASAGKSLVSLAIGKLLDDGLIDSLDQPVHAFFPEWKQGRKKLITIRMLLNHTSGLQDLPNASIELEPAPDWQVDHVIRLALAAELQSEPGEHIFYSNKAVALLGGIIEKASGLRMDEYFKKAFYGPMGITEYDWIRDKAGNPTAHGAFVIQPSDLLKFGLMMLNDGVYDGKKIVGSSWIKQSTQLPGSDLLPIWGLLWWRLPLWEKRKMDEEIIGEWKKEGVSASFIKKVSPLVGQTFEDREAYNAAMENVLGKKWRQELREEVPHYLRTTQRIFSEKQLGYYADGFRGNYLVVIPEYRIVAVRCAGPEGFDYETDFFSDFVALVARLGRS